MDEKYDIPREKRSRITSIENIGLTAGWFLVALAIGLAVAFSGCESAFNPVNRSKVFLLYDNVENCTEAQAYDEKNDLKAVVPKHGVGEEELSTTIIDLKDKTYRYAQSPQSQIDAMLSGSEDAVPRGCDNWGFDVIEVRLRDGVETYEEKIRLRPPDYWEEPEHWKALSSEEQVATESFWDSQGVTLDVENPETEVLIQ